MTISVDAKMDGLDNNEFELPRRKKPKVSELPLSSAQRSSIDSMLHTFKRKGEFDSLRKKTFQQYNESAQRGMFEASLRTFTANEVERDPIKYLKPDRRIAAPLLEGAAARADVYTKTEMNINTYIEQYLAQAERALRSIRRAEVGEDAAEGEALLGAKSDEAYAAEAADRAKLREKKHAEEEKVRAKKEASERKKKELEALKAKQAELMKETERLQREQKRRAEREAWKQAEKDREKERIRKFNEDRERAKRDVEEREQKLRDETDRRRRERAEREQKRLEEEALELLLREGKAMAEKAKRPELERSESMEPPPFLHRNTAAPRERMSREEMRSKGLMPSSLTLRRSGKPSTTPAGPASSMPVPSAKEVDDREDRYIRPPRPRSPSPARSNLSRTRRESLAHDHDDRSRPSKRDTSRDRYREGTTRKENYYRDISAERAAWKARQAGPARDREEEGEVVEPSSAAVVRARSRSRESHNRRRERSRSPARRGGYRSRSRSPPPKRYRDRDESPPRRRRSPPRRRSRSRSPPGIDRYVPGGGGLAAAVAGRRGREGSRDRERSERPREREERVRERDERPREREREGERVRRRDDRDIREERPRDRERDREDRERTAHRTSRGEDEPRRVSRRETFDDRTKPVEIDRYIPGGGGDGGRTEEGEKTKRTRAEEETVRRVGGRSRSREAAKHKEREREREGEKGKEGGMVEVE